MNKYLTFAIGAIGGAVVTYFITRKFFKKKEKDIRDEAEFMVAEELTTSLDDQLKYIENFINELLGEDSDKKIDFLIDLLEKSGVGLRCEYEEVEPEEDIYSDVNPIYDDAPEEEVDLVKKIDEKTFNDGNTKWTKETIIFYDGDSTFISEDGITVDNWQQLFGNDILNWIEDHNFRRSNLFIRNIALTSDYQIVYKEIAYSEEGGEDDDYEPGDMAD